MNKLLIFDLDDTIFETKTIGVDALKTVFDSFESLAIKKYGHQIAFQIIEDLWKLAFDIVAKKYNFDEELTEEFVEGIEAAKFKFNIKTFDDFKLIQDSNIEKVLVTTGFESLQKAKIKGLDLQESFTSIHIDDILKPNRIFKKGIFSQIIQDRNLKKEAVFIIGDNSESELKAGYELGLPTIQVSKKGQEKSRYATYFISDYSELLQILN